MKLRFAFLICISLLFFVLLISTIWPAGVKTVELPVTIQQPGWMVERKAMIELPKFIRQGESGMVRLRLLPMQAETILETYPLEARIEIPNLPARDHLIRETLLAGSGSTFSWEIKSEEPGEYSGKLWLWVGEGENRQVVLAAPLAITCVLSYGLSTRWARAAGLGGAVIFLILGANVYLKKFHEEEAK
jgi:hypothetical protein